MGSSHPSIHLIWISIYLICVFLKVERILSTGRMLAFLKDQGGIYNEETTKGLAQILLIAAVRDFDKFFFHQWDSLLQLHPPKCFLPLRPGARCCLFLRMHNSKWLNLYSFSSLPFHRFPILDPSSSECIPIRSRWSLAHPICLWFHDADCSYVWIRCGFSSSICLPQWYSCIGSFHFIQRC